jgi:large subunit ribosomal protein L35
MPKLKTHSNTKKKIKVTKNGKVISRKAGGHHFLQKKSTGRKRTYAGVRELGGKAVKTIKKRLGA